MRKPYATGSNWTHIPGEGWRWSSDTDDITFLVSQHSAPFGAYYRLTAHLEGRTLRAFGQRSTPAHWFQRAADIYGAWSTHHLDFSAMPERWSVVDV